MVGCGVSPWGIARKGPQQGDFVQGFFHARVGVGIPLLQEVDAQHLGGAGLRPPRGPALG